MGSNIHYLDHLSFLVGLLEEVVNPIEKKNEEISMR